MSIKKFPNYLFLLLFTTIALCFCTNKEISQKSNFQASSICSDGEFAPTVNDACNPHTVCTPGSEYEAVAPSPTSDRVCKAITICDESTQWEEQAPSETSDRVCKDLTTCTSEQFELLAPGPRADRQCKDLTVCSDSQYQSQAHGPKSDRVCRSKQACTSSQYESIAATDTSDRACASLSICTDGQFEERAPTATSDKVCKAIAAKCTEGTHWEQSSPTKTSDRICKPYTKDLSCPAGEKSIPGNATTDHTCTACPDGTYATEGTNACSQHNSLKVADCTEGTFFEKADATRDNSCTTCPAGEYAAAGLATCTEANAGHYAYIGDAKKDKITAADLVLGIGIKDGSTATESPNDGDDWTFTGTLGNKIINVYQKQKGVGNSDALGKEKHLAQVIDGRASTETGLGWLFEASAAQRPSLELKLNKPYIPSSYVIGNNGAYSTSGNLGVNVPIAWIIRARNSDSETWETLVDLNDPQNPMSLLCTADQITNNEAPGDSDPFAYNKEVGYPIAGHGLHKGLCKTGREKWSSYNPDSTQVFKKADNPSQDKTFALETYGKAYSQYQITFTKSSSLSYMLIQKWRMQFYDNSSGASIEKICPAGTKSTSVGTGSTSCDICPAGKYAAAGSSACTVCPAGEYAAAGSGACVQAEAGYFAARDVKDIFYDVIKNGTEAGDGCTPSAANILYTCSFDKDSYKFTLSYKSSSRNYNEDIKSNLKAGTSRLFDERTDAHYMWHSRITNNEQGLELHFPSAIALTGYKISAPPNNMVHLAPINWHLYGKNDTDPINDWELLDAQGDAQGSVSTTGTTTLSGVAATHTITHPNSPAVEDWTAGQSRVYTLPSTTTAVSAQIANKIKPYKAYKLLFHSSTNKDISVNPDFLGSHYPAISEFNLYYNAAAVGATAQIACPAGTYSAAGASACTACKGGYYCPVGSATQIACPLGQISGPKATSCKSCKADLNECNGSGSGWVKILKYKDKYTPNNAQVGDLENINDKPSLLPTTELTKRADSDINDTAYFPKDGNWHYYLLEEEGITDSAQQAKLLVRSTADFDDKAISLGWTGATYEVCTEASQEACKDKWNPGQWPYFETISPVPNSPNGAKRWFTGWSTSTSITYKCYKTQDQTNRCFSSGSADSDHRSRHNVNIYKWKKGPTDCSAGYYLEGAHCSLCPYGTTSEAGAQACTLCTTSLASCKGSGWIKILKYKLPYQPQTTAFNETNINDPATSGFAKRSDSKINSKPFNDPYWRYYLLEEEDITNLAQQTKLLVRSAADFNDTAPGLGWTADKYEVCIKASKAACGGNWKSALGNYFDTQGRGTVNNNETRWFTDVTYKCFKPKDQTNRCFSSGSEDSGHRTRENVNIYKWKFADCSAGYYKEATGTCTLCPYGKTSEAGAVGSNQCTTDCSAGYYKKGTTCELCPYGKTSVAKAVVVSACKPCGATLTSCKGSGWVKILKYNNHYTPSNSKIGDIATINTKASTGNVKRTDSDINNLTYFPKDGNIWHYYLLEEEDKLIADQDKLFVRSSTDFNDTAKSLGWSGSVCPEASWIARNCDWKKYPIPDRARSSRFNYHPTGSLPKQRWYTDWGDITACSCASSAHYAGTTVGRRCFCSSAGIQIRSKVNIYKWKQ
jgi:hypothetical protein